MAIRLREKNFRCLQKKCPNLRSLLLFGGFMWPSKFVVTYFFGNSVARGSFCAVIHLYSTTFKIRKFSKFFLSVESTPGVREKCTLPFHGLFLSATRQVSLFSLFTHFSQISLFTHFFCFRFSCDHVRITLYTFHFGQSNFPIWRFFLKIEE